MSNFDIPPLDGSLLLYELLDHQAARYPDRPFYTYTLDSAPKNAINITHARLNSASHRAAHAFSKADDYSPHARECVAVFILTETIAYNAILIGLLRAGFVPFLMSPRNSAAAIASMMHKTDCHRMFATSNLHAFIPDIKSELEAISAGFKLKIADIPSMDALFPEKETEARLPEERFPALSPKPALDDVAFFLHSSGSTGLSKAIPQSHRVMLNWCSMEYLTGYWRSFSPPIIMAAMQIPPFHTLGICVLLLAPLIAGVATAVYPPEEIPLSSIPYLPTPSNLDRVIEHARRAKCNAITAVPAFIHAWSRSADVVSFMKSLHFITYAGGAVLPKIGNYLCSEGVKLVCTFGATETGCASDLRFHGELKDGWMYMRIDKRLNIYWEPQGDGTFESVFMTCSTHIPAITNISTGGYASSDLWEPHPLDDGLWRLVGRLDDVIVHSTGAKTAPGPIEDIISADSLVQGALMFGAAHATAGIIIEPKSNLAIDPGDEMAIEDYLNRIWPSIEEANKDVPPYSRILKDKVVIVQPNMPLPRASKGTILRKAALNLYQDHINALY